MSENDNKSDPTAPSASFDYIKSNLFRSIRADGAIGGITPNGHIHMAFYSERHAIPKREVYSINEDGTLNELREAYTRSSYVREMDVDVFLALDVAKNVHEWLGKVIEESGKDVNK